MIIRFDEIEVRVHSRPGIYEIHTDSGTPLKVGIGGDILERLKQHRNTKQDKLKLKVGGDRSNPDDVDSKQSILAKHLYYDRTITPLHDLTTEAGRRAFLREKCYISFEYTETREKARDLERSREHSGRFRYTGRVVYR